MAQKLRAGPPCDALDASHPAVLGHQARHAGRAADLGAGRTGRVEQQRVEERSARGAQRGYPVARANVDRLDVVAVAELRRVNGRGARGDKRLEQTPAVKLQHAAAHKRVRGQRVGALTGSLNDEHP